MTVDEGSRRQLYQKLEEVLGSQEATTLMEHLVPGGAARVATKDDLQNLKHELLSEMHRNSRQLFLSLVTTMALLNGLVIAAVKL